MGRGLRDGELLLFKICSRDLGRLRGGLHGWRMKGLENGKGTEKE
jgi:hypothetical protein